MRKITGYLLLAGLIFLTASCKSNFEKIRTSGDQEAILKAAFDYYEKGQYQRSQSLFDLVLNTIKGDPRAEKAYFCYAYTHYYLKQYLLAAYYFKNFSNTFVNSEFREEAAFMSAYSNYQLSPTYRLDQTSTVTAIEEFQLFVNLFPNSKRVDECNKLIDELRRKLEEKAFAEGELYFNLRQYQSAVISFDNLLRDYPESPDVERVSYLIAKASYLLSENSIVEKKEERYNETIKRANDFLEKYSNGKYVKEIKQIRKDSEDAVKSVKKRLKTT
ncbi:MAG: outer membrane protein assembly factor BamD [Saprospiraceae bacterium]|nr:outer membrane protein assembly factor BamD [Saprospiraceae bacterium]